MSEFTRRYSPAAERNSQPILAALQAHLPALGPGPEFGLITAQVLEIASGTGQHASCFAAALPHWRWQPTEADLDSLASIDDWCAGLPNVQPALQLDVLAAHWPAAPGLVDAIYCANLLHIAPWAACPGLMQGAARHLKPNGALLIYGPFMVEGQPVAASNQAFDADLRQRDPRWGLRSLSAVQAEASAAGLRWMDPLSMPANNLLLIFHRP